MRTSASQLLVVEDSDEDFETVVEAVEKSGMPLQVHRVTTGTQCLDWLKERAVHRDRLPALVLLDLNTPVDDGRVTLKSIRATPQLRELPLVVLSTSAVSVDIEYCYATGANAYHTKPIDYGKHLEVLDQILKYWFTAAKLPSLHGARHL